MKVLAINGSPRTEGNTAQMLQTVLDVCAASGYETALFQAGGRPVRGCTGCGACGQHIGRCAYDDWVNELYPKMKEANAVIMGSPTYFFDLTPELKAVMDRCGSLSRRDGMAFSRKIGAAVSVARRAGTVHVLDSIQHFFLINDMVVVGSTYLNLGIARAPGDFGQDEEGIQTGRRLGENISWLLPRLSD